MEIYMQDAVDYRTGLARLSTVRLLLRFWLQWRAAMKEYKVYRLAGRIRPAAY
jgi:hypothetical protein